jgi:N-methylhydantoinase A
VILGVDVGGTFTDAALLTGERLVVAKSPSTPADQSEGVMEAVSEALSAARASAADVTRFVHGMTVGTNALLEGRVARTALLATEGFTDLEELGRQARPELYRLCAGHPPPLVPASLRVAVPERTGPDGVLRPLDEEALRAALRGVDCEAAAVCLLWGFRHPGHEQRVSELVEEALGDEVHVSTSHETAGVFREYERCATTIVDAAVSPLLRGYLSRLTERASAAGLPEPEVMLSSGGTASAATAARHGSWTVLSGPAGGAVGAARVAEQTGGRSAAVGGREGASAVGGREGASRGGRDANARRSEGGGRSAAVGGREGASAGSVREGASARGGRSAAVGLDMGGTSCDVSLAIGGAAAVGHGREIGGRALALPMVDVHTVGAGGGSIAWRDAGGALRVGPRSAGAAPGPACYGRGGTDPTVTDADLLLGWLDSDSPLAGGVRLDREAAERAVEALANDLGLTVEEAAAGIARVASTEMAQAVRVVTVERGIDPREMALVAFGGAGPLHATQIADELGMRHVIAPIASGVLSALGLVVSERRRDVVESVLLGGEDLTREAVTEVVERLAERAREGVRPLESPEGVRPLESPEGVRPLESPPLKGSDPLSDPLIRATYDLRYAGQAFELSVDGALSPAPDELRTAFDRAHEERYGYADPDADLELVTVRVAAALPGAEPPPAEPARAEERGARAVRFGDDRVEACVLGPGEAQLDGPAIFELPGATLVVPPGWHASADADAVVLER